ncbi:MAG: hypothetical protein H6Q26_3164 [Bacteroidetes bacterium]|nr:hypothetical protein [Bacteroidota bacterium]
MLAERRGGGASFGWVGLVTGLQGGNFSFGGVGDIFQSEPEQGFFLTYWGIDKSDVALLGEYIILHVNSLLMAIATAKNTWVKWIRRVGIWGFLFFLVKGLVWLALAYWIVK